MCKKISNFAPRSLYKRGAKLGIFLHIANFHLKLIKMDFSLILSPNRKLIFKKIARGFSLY